MAATAFLGYLLLAGGPPVVIWCTFIANKSFLVLLGLASAFYWLVTLILVALVFRVLLPLPEHAGIYAIAMLVAVTAQEFARYGAYLIHRVMVQNLQGVARNLRLPSVTVTDKRLMALSHGFGLAIAQNAFLYFSWVSLSSGDETLYLDACPQMSFFLAAGLLSLAFFLLHCFSMVVAFQGYEQKNTRLSGGVAALHLLAAFTTLFNMVHGGCVPVSILALVEGSLAVAAAGAVCWKQQPETLVISHEDDL